MERGAGRALAGHVGAGGNSLPAGPADDQRGGGRAAGGLGQGPRGADRRGDSGVRAAHSAIPGRVAFCVG